MSKIGHLQKCCRTKQYNAKQENAKLNRVNPEEEDPAKYFTMHQVKALDTVHESAVHHSNGNNLFDSRASEGKQVDHPPSLHESAIHHSNDATLHSTEAPPTHVAMPTITTSVAASTPAISTCQPPKIVSPCRNPTSPQAYDELCEFGDAVNCCSACTSIDVHDSQGVCLSSAVPVKCHNKFSALSDCSHTDSTGNTVLINNACDAPVSSIKIISKNVKSYAGAAKSQNNSFLG